MMAQFRKQLMTYLQEEGVSYADCRKGGNSKQTANGLEPKVDDFVTYKSGAKIMFGRIAKITNIPNVVILTVIERNKIEEVNVHVRTIRCIYRATNQDNCTNV